MQGYSLDWSPSLEHWNGALEWSTTGVAFVLLTLACGQRVIVICLFVTLDFAA